MQLHRRQQHDQGTPAGGRTASAGSVYDATEWFLSGQLVPASGPISPDAKCIEPDPVAALKAQRAVSRMRESPVRIDRMMRRAINRPAWLERMDRGQRLHQRCAVPRHAPRARRPRARRVHRSCTRAGDSGSEPGDGEPHPRRRGGAA
jgi:hypothetical protein